MILCFELSMPNVGSWNGKWSGASDYYAKIINFGRSKKAEEGAQKILDIGYFRYDFGDGWSAGVKVKQVTASEASTLRKQSRGFCGYDWMVESIKLHQEIRSH